MKLDNFEEIYKKFEGVEKIPHDFYSSAGKENQKVYLDNLASKICYNRDRTKNKIISKNKKIKKMKLNIKKEKEKYKEFKNEYKFLYKRMELKYDKEN